MSRGTAITEQVFKLGKTLIAGGATKEYAAEVLGVSTSTVCRINRSETFDDYLLITHKILPPHLQKKTEPEQVKEAKSEQTTDEKVTDLPQTNQILTGLDKITELLVKTNELLADLILKWE